MLLGYANWRRPLDRNYARVIFRQGIDPADFIFHLYDLFRDFINIPPQSET